jgi:hypothetical protein
MMLRGLRAAATRNRSIQMRCLSVDAENFIAQFGEASYWDRVYAAELHGGPRSVKEWFVPPKVQNHQKHVY